MTDFGVIKFPKAFFVLVWCVAAIAAVLRAEPMKKLPDESEVKAVIQPVGRPVPVVLPKPEPPTDLNKPIKEKEPVAERLSK